MPIRIPSKNEPWYRKFHDLMPFRIREVLLVSSDYDAFILEEDGRLSERIFTEYHELNLSSAPRLTHVNTGKAAYKAIESRRFDLVISMCHLPDTNVLTFVKTVKKRFLNLPIVVLAFDESQIQNIPKRKRKEIIEQMFLWNGDSKILLAIIKYMEDLKNLKHDTIIADIRIILVVEDSIRNYSNFLGLLYAALMNQSQSLIAEGFNDLHRLMRMRARPKIILATNFEEAEKIYKKYKTNLLAVISDVRYPRKGKLDGEAGFKLAKKIRKELADVPILLQSAELENLKRAASMGLLFLNKNSSRLNMHINQFLEDHLGFGDFVFRMPDFTEVGRARDMYELEAMLAVIPEESLSYHSERNHISTWLMARSEIKLARELRTKQVSDFMNFDHLREYLIGVFRAARKEVQEGVISDFSFRMFEPDSVFVRLGEGSIGGKARGIAFLNMLINKFKLTERYEGLHVAIPKTYVVSTEEFDRFLDKNKLSSIAYYSNDDAEITKRFS